MQALVNVVSGRLQHMTGTFQTQVQDGIAIDEPTRWVNCVGL